MKFSDDSSSGDVLANHFKFPKGIQVGACVRIIIEKKNSFIKDMRANSVIICIMFFGEIDVRLIFRMKMDIDESWNLSIMNYVNFQVEKYLNRK